MVETRGDDGMMRVKSMRFARYVGVVFQTREESSSFMASATWFSLDCILARQ